MLSEDAVCNLQNQEYPMFSLACRRGNSMFPCLSLRGDLVVAVDKVSTFEGSPSFQASDGTVRDVGAIRSRTAPESAAVLSALQS